MYDKDVRRELNSELEQYVLRVGIVLTFVETVLRYTPISPLCRLAGPSRSTINEGKYAQRICC